MHAARLITALLEIAPGVSIEGIGGPAMQSAGATMIEPMDHFSAMGLVEAAASLPHHLRLLAELRRRLTAGHYSLVILVDYPGFHLRLAAIAAARGTPVLYYVAPQIWAWGERRASSLRRNVAMMAVVLPFEEAYFRSKGIPAWFVGHPLLDGAPSRSQAELRGELGWHEATPVVGLFPGSRKQEIERHWPIFRDAATTLRASIPELEVIVAATETDTYPDPGDFTVWRGRSRDVLAASDVALCKSGTVTLEAALTETPMVVAYRMNPLTYHVARRAVRVDRIALVNLLAGHTVAPEFVQGEARPAALAAAVEPLLERNGPEALRQRAALAQVRQELGTPGAGRRVAEMALELVT